MSGEAPLVLIVDDDDDSRYVYTRLLSHRGFRVAEAESGPAGVDGARALLPALVIMDYILPGFNGWEATRRIKADPATALIPVINLTAYTYDGIGEDARAAGCDLFIQKPCDPFDVIQGVIGLIGPADDRVPAPRVTPNGTSDDIAFA